MEIVERALWDAILDLDAALDILLLRELHLVIDCGCIFPFVWLPLHHSFLLHFVDRVGVVALSVDLLFEWEWLIVLAAHVERGIGSGHQSDFIGVALNHVSML